MRIDMKPILSGETDEIAVDYTFDLPSDSAPDGVIFTSGAHVSGKIHDDGGYISLKLGADVPYKGECARCLCEVEGVFHASLEKGVTEAGKLENEDTDDYLMIENSMLTLDDALVELVVLDFPSRLLCSEDCLGLCPKCGKNLNDGDCGCPTKEADPRLAVLAKLLGGDTDNK